MVVFRYSYVTVRGRNEPGSADIEVGDVVRSKYRARWTGVVTFLDKTDGCACVRVTHTRRGVPMRKPPLHRLHCAWLVVVERGGVKRSAT